RMDDVAAQLCAGDLAVHLVAVTGHDRRARAALERLHPPSHVGLTVLGWTDEIPALMQAAAVLVTKPGGVTIAEATACGLPIVMSDPIPGPEEHNAQMIVASGAGILARGPVETVAAVNRLLNDARERQATSEAARRHARPNAAALVAELV